LTTTLISYLERLKGSPEFTEADNTTMKCLPSGVMSKFPPEVSLLVARGTAL
jgi:hypothetical protein